MVTVTAANSAAATAYAAIIGISVVVVTFVSLAAAVTFVFFRSLRALLPFYVQLCFYFLFVGLFMSQKEKNADRHLLFIYLYICVRILFTFY